MWTQTFYMLSEMYLNEKQVFSKTPDMKDWARFYEYTINVRVLTLKEESKEDLEISMREIFWEISISRTQLYIFPGLVKLHISLSSFYAKCAPLYLNPEISDIRIYINNLDLAGHLARIFDIISNRIISLSSLSLYSDSGDLTWSLFQMRSNFRTLLAGQSHLRYLYISGITVSWWIFGDLSTSKRLQVLRLKDSEAFPRPNLNNLLRLNWNHVPTNFSSLRKFEIDVPFTRIKEVFSSFFKFGNLRHLSIITTSAGTPDEYGIAMETVAGSCEALTEFSWDTSRLHPTISILGGDI